MGLSSKQITGIVVAAAAAVVLVPTAAVASGASLTTIMGGGHSAHVTSQHRLETSGQAALEARPFASFDRAGNNPEDRVILVGPTSRTIALSSLTASATGGEVGVRLRAVQPTDGSCAAGHVVIVRGELMSFVVPADDSHTVEFPSPIVVKPARGKQVCLLAEPDTTYVPASGAELTVSGSGYLR